MLVGAVIITLLLYIWFSSVIMEDGRRLQLDSANKIFTYYCGRYLGKFFEIFTPIFLFLVFSVMIAGAGATLNEYYGLNPQTGRIIMAVLALGTVILGLDGLVSIVSKIGPAIIIFAVIVGIGNIVMNPSGLAKANETMAVKRFSFINQFLTSQRMDNTLPEPEGLRDGMDFEFSGRGGAWRRSCCG